MKYVASIVFLFLTYITKSFFKWISESLGHISKFRWHTFELKIWPSRLNSMNYKSLYFQKHAWLSYNSFVPWGNKKYKNAFSIRYLLRFFDHWAHEITYAYMGNKHFFTKWFSEEMFISKIFIHGFLCSASLEGYLFFRAYLDTI